MALDAISPHKHQMGVQQREGERHIFRGGPYSQSADHEVDMCRTRAAATNALQSLQRLVADALRRIPKPHAESRNDGLQLLTYFGLLYTREQLGVVEDGAEEHYSLAKDLFLK